MDQEAQIKTVFHFRYGNVAVVDNNGRQQPQYQGPYEMVKRAIARDAPPDAVFLDWRADGEVSKEDFLSGDLYDRELARRAAKLKGVTQGAVKAAGVAAD